MRNWEIKPIDQLCELIVDCVNRTAPKVEHETPFKMIRTTNVRHGRINLDDVNYVEEATFLKWTRRKVPQRNDIILTREAPLGEVGILKSDDRVFLGQRTVMYRANLTICDPYFLFYSLLSPHCQNHIRSFASGSTVEHMRVPDSKKIEIPTPPLPIQKRIAEILSAYDDLIENNLKRIKLLEELAQRTYEEWFVKFRVNGEQLPIDESTGLPVGWTKKKLVEVAVLTMGQSPRSEFYNSESKGLPFHQGVSDYGYRFPDNSNWSTEGNRFAEKGDILFSVRAPVGRLNVAIEKIILGRGLASIREKNDRTSQLFYQLQNIFFKDDIIGGGAIFNSVTKNDVERIEIIVANEHLSKKFNAFAHNIDKQIENLTLQNRTLKQSRDILLPRLMNGSITVTPES